MRRVCALLCLCLLLSCGAFAAEESSGESSPLSEITCSRWAKPAVFDAAELGLLPTDTELGKDYTKPITRVQFVALALELIAAEKDTDLAGLAALYDDSDGSTDPADAQTAAPFSDTSDPKAVLAAEMGIAKGSNGLFRPDDGITRCEAAAMLYRCMALLGRPEANAAPAVFSDAYAMPRWSVEAIKYCAGRTAQGGTAIMSGSGGLFSPLESYTIEQAIATLLRCHQSLPEEAVFAGWRSAAGYDSVTLDLTFGGDCTFGSGIGFSYAGSFPQMYEQMGPDYFFSGIDEFFTDDLTMVNFEGTLTTASAHAVKTFCFKGSPEYAKALQSGSIDVVTVANNHSMDYLQRGFEDTLANLSPYVSVSAYELLPVLEVKGVKVGFASNLAWDCGTAQKAFADNAIASLRERGAEIIVFNYHWGIERNYTSSAYQRTLAHYCIDAGADLVIGHHPHVVQETETYKGRQIVYSLGNLVFGGNHNPQDKNCLIFRQSFTVDLNSRAVSEAGHEAIPYKVSSVSYRNDYHPTKQ